MTEFKVQLEDKIVQTIGYDTINKFFNENIEKLILKICAKDVIEDLKNIQLENDEKWKIAREEAWNEQGYKYNVTFSSNYLE